MEESERYCRKCELAKQYGGGLEEYLLRYLAQLTPEEQAEDVTYARRLWHVVGNAHGIVSICAVPADVMCSFVLR